MRVGPRTPSEPCTRSFRMYGALISARFSPRSEMPFTPICTCTGSGVSMQAFNTVTRRCFSSMASSKSRNCPWLCKITRPNHLAGALDVHLPRQVLAKHGGVAQRQRALHDALVALPLVREFLQ